MSGNKGLPEGVFCAKLRHRGSTEDAAALFSVSLPSESPWNMQPPLQSTHVSFSTSPRPPLGTSGAKKGIQDPNYFTKKIHLSGSASAKLSAWQARPWPQSWQRDGVIPPTESQVILSNTYSQVLPKLSTARCPVLPGACAGDAGASGQALQCFQTQTCPGRGAEPTKTSSYRETALETSMWWHREASLPLATAN